MKNNTIYLSILKKDFENTEYSSVSNTPLAKAAQRYFNTVYCEDYPTDLIVRIDPANENKLTEDIELTLFHGKVSMEEYLDAYNLNQHLHAEDTVMIIGVCYQDCYYNNRMLSKIMNHTKASKLTLINNWIKGIFNSHSLTTAQ